MRAYKVQRDEDWPWSYEIAAHSKWQIPAVKCPECRSRGAAAGVRYPSLLLPEGVDPAPYLAAATVAPERHRELLAPLLRAWGQQVRALPGAGFGPLVGKAWGKCGDVGWAGFSTLLRSDAAERLRRAGIGNLKPVRTEREWRSRRAPEYLELDIPATARLSPAYVERLRLFDGAVRCRACGFLRRKFSELPDRKARLSYEELSYYTVVHAPSLPRGWSLLRIQDAETTVIASERFRDAALEAGLTNITFREVAVESLLLTW